MGTINDIIQVTHNDHLNYYELHTTKKTGEPGHYYFASRALTTDGLELRRKKSRCDGVAVFVLVGEKRDRVLLIRQFRIPLGCYVYEFPAGLVDRGEDYRQAAVREMHEETGLTFSPIQADEMFEAARFTTAGLTDESCCMVYGYASGEPSRKYLEEGEDIQIILADRNEIRRILKEEKVALMTAYQLMHFLADEEPFAFLTDNHGQIER